MRIVDIREKTVPISRYADPTIAPLSLTTSLIAVVSDIRGEDGPLTGYGFASVGRFAQGGLISERFAPRLLAAAPDVLDDAEGNVIDPVRAWSIMMQGEKPGGHGERCVAVGALDMALWDLAAKARNEPLYRMIAKRFGRSTDAGPIPVYAGGGYYYPDNDIHRLQDEVARFKDLGLDRVKIKIGSAAIDQDVRRIEAVLAIIGCGKRLAVDALNSYARADALAAAHAIESFDLAWFEDICDPLDYETHRHIAEIYRPPVSAGEALFSAADARNLRLYGGLRPRHDVLTFDPAHCYGLPEYVRIVEAYEAHGWSRTDFQPHGGHLFGLHVTAGLGLGGCESNPCSFQPFGGFGDGDVIERGLISPPQALGLYQRRSVLPLVMASNRSLGQARCAGRCRRIVQAPERTRWPVSGHRRPRAFARRRRCVLLAVPGTAAQNAPNLRTNAHGDKGQY